MINKYVKKAVTATIVSILGTYSPVFAANPTFGIPAGTISINVNDISRAGAIELLADHFGLKTMFHVPVDGTMQLNLTNSTCDEAITLALAGTGVTYMIENGNLHIFQAREAWNKDKEASASQLSSGAVKEPIIAKIVKLKNRSAQDVQKLLKDLDQQISCTFDSPTNSLIIRGEQSKIESCLELIDGIDALEITENSKQKGMQSSVLVTKTFFLEHADFDAIEQELENVIERDSNSSDSNSSNNKLVDKNGNPLDNEYFLLDKSRRTIVIHTIEQKMRVLEEYFNAVNTPLPQVLIEAQIISVKESLNKNLGIDWQLGLGYNAPGAPFSAKLNPLDSFKLGTWNLGGNNAAFRAAESNGDIKVLSRPRILAVSGKEASIHVGDELPYVSSQTDSSGGSSTQNVEYKEVGVKLNVTPTINPKAGTIFMKLTPEVSEELKPVMIGGNRVPVITTRKSESTIEVRNGETMVIGGLLKDEENVSISGVPILKNLPGFLGQIFKNKTKRKEKTNLMILLTPRIINNDYKAELTKPATVEFNEKLATAARRLEVPLVSLPTVTKSTAEIKAEEKAKLEAELKAKIEAELKARKEAEQKALEEQMEAELKALEEHRKTEQKAIEEQRKAELKARIEAELKARKEAEQKALEEIKEAKQKDTQNKKVSTFNKNEALAKIRAKINQEKNSQNQNTYDMSNTLSKLKDKLTEIKAINR